jgi:zinc ribbon protein
MESTAGKQVRFGEWIGEGWKMFTTQWKEWVTLSLSIFGAVLVPMMIFIIFVYVTLIATATTQVGSGASSEASPVGVFFIFGSYFLLMLVMLPLSAVLMGGMHKAALKQIRGGQIEFKDLFSARDRFLPILGALLLQGLLAAVGSFLCIIPGLIVAGLLFFTLPLIIDRKLGVIDAMKASVEMTKPNLLMFTIFAVVVQLIASVGQVACIVGLLATLPLMFTMTAAAYRDCFGVEGAALLPPAEPWAGANYSPPAQQRSAPGPTPPGTTELGTAPPASTPAPRTPTPSVCSKCGASLPATARFCFRCGTAAPGQ